MAVDVVRRQRPIGEPRSRILVVLGYGVCRARRLLFLLPNQREQADEVHRSIYHRGGCQKDMVTGSEIRHGAMRNGGDRLQRRCLVHDKSRRIDWASTDGRAAGRAVAATVFCRC